MRRASLWVAILGLGYSSACAPAPKVDARAITLGIVIDRTLQTFIRAFRVTVVLADTPAGKRVTCAEIPGSIRLGDAELVEVARSQIAWNGDPVEARLEKLRVPTEKRLIIVAQGLVRTAQNEVFTIARGCKDNYTIAAGKAADELSIDVLATIGAPCTGAEDCETGLSCHRDATTFKSGYCTKLGCTSSIQCPPGSHCIPDSASGNICTRACTNPSDCETSQGRACEGRTSATGGCSSVCVSLLWNMAGKCSR